MSDDKHGGLDSGIGGVEEVNNVATQDHVNYGEETGIQTDDTYIPYFDYEEYDHYTREDEEVTDPIAQAETNILAGDPVVEVGYSADTPERMLEFAIKQILNREKVPGRRKVGARYFRCQSVTLSPGGSLSEGKPTRIARDDGRRAKIVIWSTGLTGNTDIFVSHEMFSTSNTTGRNPPPNAVSLAMNNGNPLIIEGEGDIYLAAPSAMNGVVLANVFIEYT